MKNCLLDIKTERQPTFRPMVFWAWNDGLDHSELRRQLDAFKKQGIGGVFVHARAGLRVSYLSSEWVDAFRVVVEHCKTLGVEVWIYDEEGWPSGFAGGLVCEKNSEFRQKHLCLTKKYNEASTERIIAAYSIKNGEYYL